MKRFGSAPAVVAFAVTAAIAVYGQEPRTQPGSDKSQSQSQPAPASRTDAQAFVNEMAIAGMTEIQLGKIAAERATNPDVKAFGQMMVKDHTQASNELKEIASQLKLQLPNTLDKKHQDLVDRLSKLQGAEFDREYMKAMVPGHEEVLGKVKARAEMQLPPQGLGAGKTEPGKAPGDRGTEAGRGDTTGRGRGEEALTRWAAKAMPTVQQHLDRARQIEQKATK